MELKVCSYLLLTNSYATIGDFISPQKLFMGIQFEFVFNF